MRVARVFEVERLGRVIVLNLRRGVQEIEFDEPPPDARDLLELVRKAEVDHVIVDCHDIDFLRSTALGFFVTVWKRVAARGGCMTFCHASAKAREILRATKLDRIWKICGSRAEAMEEVEQHDIGKSPGPAGRPPGN